MYCHKNIKRHNFFLLWFNKKKLSTDYVPKSWAPNQYKLRFAATEINYILKWNHVENGYFKF